jgi:putative Mg2+ transporter-C (MgtC) family protein
VSNVDFIIRLGCALLLGAAIGLERQWRQRMAGLRTNALVSTGAAMFVMLSGLMGHDTSPTRIAAQVVSGIGFLGAGVIMRDGLNVRGLNTAATLWCAGAVGTLTGAGLLLEATLGAGAVLCANILLRPVALRINRNPVGSAEEPVNYTINAVCLSENEQHIRALLLQMLSNSPLVLKSLLSEDLSDPRKLEVRAELSCATRCDQDLEQTVSRLSLEGGVSAVSWHVALPE